MWDCFNLEVKGGGKCAQCENSSPRKLKTELSWCQTRPPDFVQPPRRQSPFSPLGQGDADSLNKGWGKQRSPGRDEPHSLSPSLTHLLPLRQSLRPGGLHLNE